MSNHLPQNTSGPDVRSMQRVLGEMYSYFGLQENEFLSRARDNGWQTEPSSETSMVYPDINDVNYRRLRYTIAGGVVVRIARG